MVKPGFYKHYSTSENKQLDPRNTKDAIIVSPYLLSDVYQTLEENAVKVRGIRKLEDRIYLYGGCVVAMQFSHGGKIGHAFVTSENESWPNKALMDLRIRSV